MCVVKAVVDKRLTSVFQLNLLWGCRTPSLAALDSDVEDSAESSDEEADDAFSSQEASVPSAEPDV